MKNKTPIYDPNRGTQPFRFEDVYCAKNAEARPDEIDQMYVLMVGDMVVGDVCWYVHAVDPETFEPTLVQISTKVKLDTPLVRNNDQHVLAAVTYDDLVLHHEVVVAAQNHTRPLGVDLVQAMYEGYGLKFDQFELINTLYLCMEGDRDGGPGAVSPDWRVNVVANVANGGNVDNIRQAFDTLLLSAPDMKHPLEELIENGMRMFHRQCVIQNTQESITSLLGTFFSMQTTQPNTSRSIQHLGKRVGVFCTSKDDRRSLHPILAMVLDLVDLSLWNRSGSISYLLGEDANSPQQLGYCFEYFGETGAVEYPAGIIMGGDKGVILLHPPTRN
jgi:hypothetical protein